MSNWKDRVKRISPEHAKELSSSNSGTYISDDMKVGGKYIPKIDTTLLSEEHFPGNCLRLRILPPTLEHRHKDYCHVIFKYVLRDFDIGIEEICFHPKIDGEGRIAFNAIDKFRMSLYKDGSEKAKEFAKNLFFRRRGFLNVVAQKLPLIDNDGNKGIFEWVGPRVLSVPEKMIATMYAPVNDPDRGDPSDLERGFDFLYRVYYRETAAANGKDQSKRKFPQYEKSEFRVKPTRAHDDDRVIEKWLDDSYELTEEFTDPGPNAIEKACELLKEKWGGRTATTGRGASFDDDRSDDSPDDEIPMGRDRNVRSTNDEPKTSKSSRSDDDDRSRASKSSRADDDDDDDRSRASKSSRADDDDDRPRRSSRRDDDHDDKPKSSRSDDDDRPRASKSSRFEDDENDRTKASKSSRFDDDDDDRTKASKSSRFDDDDDDKPKTSKSSRFDDDEDDEDDAILGRRLDDINDKRSKKKKS
jgi:hypothetical protein